MRRLSDLRTGDRIGVDEYRRLVSAAMTEDELLVTVEELLTIGRWRWHHVRRSDRAVQQGDAGYPDIVAIRDSRGLAVELKSGAGRPGPGQLEWLEAFDQAGFETAIWRPDDLDEIRRVLG